ncbi:MAG TPA: 2-hydroxyacyl-CoA dehydratase [Dehalococcoidia bacterium]|nr:2-hydroxyacyl-CoA dehydratase [Dehalococcoidia bacterium]
MLRGFQRFREVVEGRHQYAIDWKARNGGKVFGYICTYVPEEVLYAAGILPVRILGGHEPVDMVEPHIHSMFCPFSRDVLGQALKGRYSYLEGLTVGHTCMHIHQAFEAWEFHAPVPFSYLLFVPACLSSPHARTCYLEEVKLFKSALEEWLGSAITQEALEKAVQVYNRSRRLLRQLYDLRKQDSPPVSGSMAMEAALSSMFMDKEEHSRLLEDALKDLGDGGDGRHSGIRLMVVGGENDDIDFVRMVESLGGTVVIDDQCTGSRYFWQETALGDDPLAAIADRYVDAPPCPTKELEERRRLDHMATLFKEFRAQGAILVNQKFCDPHQIDFPAIESFFEERGIPTLFLELDMTTPVGQFKTRVEAFLEMMQLELL